MNDSGEEVDREFAWHLSALYHLAPRLMTILEFDGEHAYGGAEDGGVGIYSAERFFALLDDNCLYFRVQVPAEVLEDVGLLADWAHKALRVAERGTSLQEPERGAADDKSYSTRQAARIPSSFAQLTTRGQHAQHSSRG